MHRQSLLARIIFFYTFIQVLQVPFPNIGYPDHLCMMTERWSATSYICLNIFILYSDIFRQPLLLNI